MELDRIAQLTQELFEAFFDIVHSEDWKSYDIPDQGTLRDLVEEYTACASIIREKFDSDVWKGHANGTVSPIIQSVRKQREGDTPGKKAEPVTAQSLLTKRLTKKK